jgi:hypothetical protein
VSRTALLERDPDNRLLAHGPAVRLSAEVIRDQALAVSGLLVEQIGGPGARPYQPLGLWAQANYLSEQVYQPDTGSGLYRRSVYTYWRRMIPPPGLQLLGAPSRDGCTTKRPRTNTPLQALHLLNNSTFVEAAGKLAERISHSSKVDVDKAFDYVLGRRPTPKERSQLFAFHRRQLEAFRDDPKITSELLEAAKVSTNSQPDSADLAAAILLIRVLLNLDETITKR